MFSKYSSEVFSIHLVSIVSSQIIKTPKVWSYISALDNKHTFHKYDEI
jgi:hypothetical protein